MSIYEKLFDWQKKIVDNFKTKKAFGLFLDMGLGKTPLSLAFAEANECTKVIVITINSKATESVDEQGSWFNWASKSKIKYSNITKHFDGEFSRKSADMLLINYEALFKRNSKRNELSDILSNFIRSCPNNNVAIIVDESHKMKNLNSRQTKAIFQIKKMCNLFANETYTYLLSGTPFTTGYIDLYSQLKMLGYQETKGTFIDNFCERGNVPGLLGWQQPIVGYKNVEDLFDLVHTYGITIESKNVINLPDTVTVNYVDEQSVDFKLFTLERYDRLFLESYAKAKRVKISLPNKKTVNNPFYRNIAYPDQEWLAETIGTFWLRARQLSIGFQGNAESAKWFDKRRLRKIERFLDENQDNYVLFYNYTPELVELYDICEKLGYNIDVYCGDIKNTQFYEAYSAQTPSQRLTNKKNIILANFASGSTGKNWQLYNKCIIFSLPLFKDWEQGIKRVHRIGQTSTVFYYVFSQKNWLESSMRSALNNQIQYSNDMFAADLARINELMKDDEVLT